MDNKVPHHLLNGSGIYIIRNSINHKIYIGSAVVFVRRFRQHKHLLLSGRHPSKHLLRHVAKYGIDTLSFELLESCPVETIISREQFYLDSLQPFVNNGFNTSAIAGSTIGVKHTEEAKRKMSMLKKGKKPGEEVRARMSRSQRGRRMSPETIEKMRRAQSNKSYGPEARRNMSLSHIGKKQSQETKDKRAAALRGKTKNGTVVLNLSTGIFYDSIKDAAFACGLVHSTLHRKVIGIHTNNTPFVIA